MVSHYTYLVGWPKLDRWYYGKRSSAVTPKDDLWVNYFTSSKYVKEMRSIHGEPDVIEVRRVFSDREKCSKWETRVLRRMKVGRNNKMVNRTAQYPDFDRHGYVSVRDVDGKTMGVLVDDPRYISGELVPVGKGVPKTDDHKNKLSEVKLGSTPWNSGIHQWENKEHPKGMLGKTHSDDAKLLMSRSRSGKTIKKWDEETKKNHSIRMMGNGKGKVRINNGVVETTIDLRIEHMPYGFELGRLYGTTTGRKTYTNGVLEIKLLPSSVIPEGYTLGRKPYKKGGKKC